MQPATKIDDQPISATFFGEGSWLTDFITPNALEVEELHKGLTGGIDNLEDRITVLWSWVANNVKYTKFVKAKIWVNGHASTQTDYWQTPSQAIRTTIGNCANKTFLLASLIRNELGSNKIYAVLGNLHNGKPGGHAWVQVNLAGADYVMESTRPDVPPFVPVGIADRYEVVHLFNDEEVHAIEGRTVLEPFTACFSTWLKDYLDFAYIEGRK